MTNTCENFHEMEDLVCGFCDDSVLFCNYEEEDLPGTYISNILTYYLQEMVIQDIRSVNDDWDLIDLIGNIGVYLPEEILDFYKGQIDLNWAEIPVTPNSNK